MKKHHHIKHKGRIILAIIILISIIFFISFKLVKRFDMVNKQVYHNYSIDLSANIEHLNSTEDILTYISEWAERQGVPSQMDEYKNLIFQKPATNGKEALPPTIICVDIDYQTINNNLSDISTAQYIVAAANDKNLTGGPLTVIFLNNENDSKIGAENLDPKFIKPESNIFYLTSNDISYSSRSSFARSISQIEINNENNVENRNCDTMIKIKIDGINPSANIISKHKEPSVISQLQSILTRLRSKSTYFQIANISVDDNGNLNPCSLEFDLLINKYDLDSYTKWLDNKSNKFVKKYKKDYPDISYKYEVVSDINSLPNTVFNSENIKSLSNILYTIKNGDYSFNDNEENNTKNQDLHIYGKNNICGIETKDYSIKLNILTEAYDKTYLEQINTENSTAASIFNAKYTIEKDIPAFENKNELLIKMLAKAYTKVNLFTNRNATLPEKWDEEFTTCSYLLEKNDNLNIIHLSISRNDGLNITNVLLNYHKWPTGKWI